MLRRKPHPWWPLYFLTAIIISVVAIKLFSSSSKNTSAPVVESMDIAATPLPTPFDKYVAPRLPSKSTYAVFFVGDSMTAALGPHPSRLSERLNAAYPDAGFIVDNYGIGGVNVTSLPDLLTKALTIDGKPEPAVLNRDFDILVIESFANNPLSDLPLEEGLQKQREVLDLTVERLLLEKPNSVIVLLATVAPSDQYAKGSVALSAQSRKDWANERRSYLENFIKYAQEKNFPLVNAYEATRLSTGDAKPGFISVDGYIHPSQMGIEFIQDSVADFIIDTQVIPSPVR